MGEAPEARDHLMKTTSIHAQENSTTKALIGERRLWTAVIVRAVEDWLSGPLRTQRAAQKFLFDDDKNFYNVCNCAGLDPASFRSRLLRVGRRVELQGSLGNPTPTMALYRST